MMATHPTTTVPQWRRRKREYRHRADGCARLLFVGYLPPGTRIEIRCPACGRMHVVDVPAAATVAVVDSEAPNDVE